MKKGLLASYVTGIIDREHGERYTTLLRFFFPELITSFILYSLPILVDIFFIGKMESALPYATLGLTNNFLHFFVKVAEAFSIGTVVLSGQFNGIAAHQDVGRTIRDSFWVTLILGFCTALSLYFGAPYIYQWYGVSEQVACMGVPFIRLRACGILFMFMYFAIIGFLRGIKNTRVPMAIFVIGAGIFMMTDYLFIMGNWGCPALGLQGSALASVLQYGVMFALAFSYMIFDKECRRYSIKLFSIFSDKVYIKELFILIWPVVLDKATLAAAYIWLGKMIAPMGVAAQVTFCAIKDIERFSFLPALAFAQIITFLVSNDFGRQKWDAIKINIKKALFLTCIAVSTILFAFWLKLDWIIGIFIRVKEFTPLVAQVFPLLSVLVFFDLLQLILSGALRGAGNVKTVMIVRLLVCLCYFGPISYLLAHLPLKDETLKFVLVYGSFYMGNALMSIIYVKRFRSDEWKQQAI